VNQIAQLGRLDALMSEIASLLLSSSPEPAWVKLRMYYRLVNLGQDHLITFKLLRSDETVDDMVADDVFEIAPKLESLVEVHVKLSVSMGQPAWFMLRMEVDHATGRFSADFTYREDPIIDDLFEDPSENDPF